MTSSSVQIFEKHHSKCTNPHKGSPFCRILFFTGPEKFVKTESFGMISSSLSELKGKKLYKNSRSKVIFHHHICGRSFHLPASRWINSILLPQGIGNEKRLGGRPQCPTRRLSARSRWFRQLHRRGAP